MAKGSYRPGEGIHLKIRFRHGSGIERIRATFVHEKDDTQIILSGIPHKQREDEWLAILSGRATNTLGTYVHKPDTLEAEYDGEYKKLFRTPLQDATFLIKDPPVGRPALVGDWEWASD